MIRPILIELESSYNIHHYVEILKWFESGRKFVLCISGKIENNNMEMNHAEDASPRLARANPRMKKEI